MTNNEYEKQSVAHAMLSSLDANEIQRKPIKHGGVDIPSLVQKDIEDRAKVGAIKYGTRLQPHNRRDALLDAYQEVLDLAQYLRQRLHEESGC